MYGNAEKNPVNWIAWSFGLFLIGLILIVSGYMFVVYLKSQHKKNQLHDEERRIEEEKAYRERLAAVNNQTVSTTFGGGTTSSIREIEPNSEKAVKSEKTETPSKINEYSVRNSDETIGKKTEMIQKEPNCCIKTTPITFKLGSKEPSIEELSSRKILTDSKPSIKKTENKGNGGEVSVEIPIKTQAPPIEKLSAEKAPGSSIGSEVSTYVISSQRSEMNNYNMLEAGRTPPTYSENALHQTSSIETFVPITQIQTSSVGGAPLTVILAPAERNSETAVSMTTPPVNHK